MHAALSCEGDHLVPRMWCMAEAEDLWRRYMRRAENSFHVANGQETETWNSQMDGSYKTLVIV